MLTSQLFLGLNYKKQVLSKFNEKWVTSEPVIYIINYIVNIFFKCWGLGYVIIMLVLSAIESVSMCQLLYLTVNIQFHER